jgi:hypothetical protein
MAPQSYYLTGLSAKQDLVKIFNSFADDINDIVGIGTSDSGYGQNHLVVAKATKEVTTSLWNELLTSMLYAGRHQGTPLFSPVSTSSVGWPTDDPYQAVPTITTDIANIVGNKLNSALGYMSLQANKISSAKAYVDPNGSPGTPIWTSANQIYYESKVQFSDADARRHFFNSGGEIRIDSIITGHDASHAQSLDWKTMLDNIAIVKIKHSITEASTGAGTEGYGFSMFSTSYQVVYSKGGTGDYSGNQLNVSAKLSGTADIEIKLAFDDSHAADSGVWNTPPYSGSWTGTDYVAGNLAVTFDEFIPTDTPDGVNLSSPNYSHISEL